MPKQPTTSVFPILKVGQLVLTPEGPGRVVAIELVGGSYWGGERLELEPPQVTVKLTESGQKTVVCPCELGLEDPRAESTLHESFEKLWPPVPEKDQEASTEPVSTDTVDETEGRGFLARKLPLAFLKTFAEVQAEVLAERVRIGALRQMDAKLVEEQLRDLRTPKQLLAHLRYSGRFIGADTPQAQGELVRTAITALVFENPSNRKWLEQLENNILGLFSEKKGHA